MKSLTGFLKTSLIGGLFVLLPLLIFYLLLGQLLDVVLLLATPIADLFPKGTFDEVQTPVLIAVILILGASFLLGLAVRSGPLRRFGRWVERSVLHRVPLYNAAKGLSRGLVGAREESAFRSAILHSPNGDREIAYVIEEHGNGRVTVLVPLAPASFAGPVKIVDGDRVEMLPASVGDASQVLAHWGVGARDLLNPPEPKS